MATKLELLEEELEKHFDHAHSQHDNARRENIEDSELYWQGRKDAFRVIRTILFGSNDNFMDFSIAVDNEDLYKTPDLEVQEPTKLIAPKKRTIND